MGNQRDAGTRRHEDTEKYKTHRVSASPFLRVVSFCGLLFLIGIWFAACRATPTPPHPPVLIHLGAADSTQLLAHDFVEAYHQARPYANVQVSVSNSSTVLREFAMGTDDLALVARNPRTDELTNPAARAVAVARDGIVVVVNPANPVTNLSREQVAKVFAGEILNWSELTKQAAQSDDAIQVLSREDGAGIRADFEQLLITDRRVTLTAVIETSEADVLAYVAANPNAIGYASFNMWRNGTQGRALSIDNIAPTLTTIQSSTYPLLHTFYLVTPNIENPDLTDFMSFVLSPSARSLITNRMATP